MNNAQVIKEDPIVVEANNPEEAADKSISRSDKHKSATAMKSLSSLKSSVHFRNYVDMIVVPEIEKARHSLSKEKDVIEIYRLQGFIEALEKFIKLEPFEKNYKFKLLRAYGERETK